MGAHACSKWRDCATTPEGEPCRRPACSSQGTFFVAAAPVVPKLVLPTLTLDNSRMYTCACRNTKANTHTKKPTVNMHTHVHLPRSTVHLNTFLASRRGCQTVEDLISGVDVSRVDIALYGEILLFVEAMPSLWPFAWKYWQCMCCTPQLATM